MKAYLALIWLIPLTVNSVTAQTLVPPEDPRQSISYWKSHAISAAEDVEVALAESVFSRLLRAWDNSRVEPGLTVVRSEGASWAASLADGNILLSRDAINASLKFGRKRGEHLLAFVLAHELAHQRSDDLWHQRFFRSLRNQGQQERQLMLSGLPLRADAIADIERKEVQADRDGMIMMSSVGFDPWQVLADTDFFTAWVESIWQQACDNGGPSAFQSACQQAQSRVFRSRSQLESLASQSVMYDLGIQALVAKNYDQARYYFTLFGREYPNRNVMSAIAISYLNEALSLHRQLMEQGVFDRVDFYYPLLLDASAGVPARVESSSQKRAAIAVQSKPAQQRLKQNLERAAEFLQKAILLDPDHRSSYLTLAIVHLIQNNPYLVRGVLQGQFIPRFGDSDAVSILLAMTSSVQGDQPKAIRILENIVNRVPQNEADIGIPSDILQYTAVYNLAALYLYQGESEKVNTLWKNLASRAQSTGDGILFRLALNQLNSEAQQTKHNLIGAPTIKGVRLGDRKPRDDSPHRISELWVEGEQYHVYVYEDGARYVSSANGKIVSASQVGGLANVDGLIKIGARADRPLKTLGLPNRRVHLSSGEYLAYDDYRLALHVDRNRVQGWFLYP